jgi:hypothetical protein
MPFVLMPNTWARLSASFHRQGVKRERAHGDGLMVDYDSPEALEEVFWRVFAEEKYIHADRLVPMAGDPETVEKFRRYVAAILHVRGEASPRRRYLSKNNNNVLRLPTLLEAFPRAHIVVPFREPLQQSSSLLMQHRRFTEEQRRDPFVRSYMTWLVHHEFGLDHRPFSFDSRPKQNSDTDALDYWLELWLHTYRWLLDNAPPSAVFVGYEYLCNRTETVWNRLCEHVGIGADIRDADDLRLAERNVDEPYDSGMLTEATQHYQALCRRTVS